MYRREKGYIFLDLVKEEFPKRLKEVRLEAQLTQLEFAEIFGISVSTLSYYETGNRTPDIVFLARLQEYFNIPTDYFLGLNNSKKRDYSEVSEKMRLTDTAIEKMNMFHNEYDSYEDYGDKVGISLLNRLLETDEFYSALNLIIYSVIDHKMVVPDEEYIKFLVTQKLYKVIDHLYSYCKRRTYGIFSKEEELQKLHCEYTVKKFNDKYSLTYQDLQDIINEEKQTEAEWTDSISEMNGHEILQCLKVLRLKELKERLKEEEEYLKSTEELRKNLLGLEAQNNGDNNPKNE